MKPFDVRSLRIGVLMGGCSSEREISLKSGHGVFEALAAYGCQAIAIDLTTENAKAISHQLTAQRLDVVFIALHGRFGEDGRIQQILEGLRLPYTGSRAKASQIAIDKILTYRCLSRQGILIPDYLVVTKTQRDSKERIAKHFPDFPIVVKPPKEGSSIGVSIVQDPKDLPGAMSKAFEYSTEIIVEGYLKGKELTVGILENKLLPVIEIRPKSLFFDFEAKYQAGMTEYLVPAQIEDNIARRIQELGAKVHRAVGCRHLSRVDFICTDDRLPYVLEINTVPGMTATSLLPKAARFMGIDYTQLCLSLIEMAYGKQ